MFLKTQKIKIYKINKNQMQILTKILITQKILMNCKENNIIYYKKKMIIIYKKKLMIIYKSKIKVYYKNIIKMIKIYQRKILINI